MIWWKWSVVGFFVTGALLSERKRQLYRGVPAGRGELPGGGAPIMGQDCNRFVITDNQGFADWLGQMAAGLDVSGSDTVFTARLMRKGFPGCQWPPASGWSITFEQSGSTGWAEFSEIVGSSR